MRLKLKENPREWQKFTAVMMILLLIISALLWRKAILELSAFLSIVGGALGISALSLACPKPFRVFYRAGMTMSFYLGKIIGAVMLTLFFLLLLTPVGLLLRALGKDLLQLKRPVSANTYWHTARSTNVFDRLF
jgi:hypothetical protein